MAKWLDIKGPVVADTVYADSTLVAKDVAFTLPGIEFLTADVQAMGNMTVPLIGLLENMELSITKIGVDNGLRRMNRLEKQSFEFRWVQNVVKSDGSTATEGCKAFVRTDVYEGDYMWWNNGVAKEYEAGLIDFDAVDATMQSYFGLMSHCSTHGLQKWIEKNIIFKRKEMADIELPQEVTQWELNQF